MRLIRMHAPINKILLTRLSVNATPQPNPKLFKTQACNSTQINQLVKKINLNRNVLNEDVATS